MRTPLIYIIAGEPSGDEIGARLIYAVHELSEIDVRFIGIGGPAMEAAGLDSLFPMTDITHVTGTEAHPFYAAVRAESGFSPRWNFNKILIGPEGEIARTWRSGTRPESAEVRGAIEALLN